MLGRRSYLDTVTEEHNKSRSRSELVNKGVSVRKNRVLPKGLSKPKNILLTNNSVQGNQRMITEKREKKETVHYDTKFEAVVESGLKSVELREIIGTGANAVVKKATSLNLDLAIKIY